MMNNQQGDVLLYQTLDDGEINIDDGIIEMSGGLETSVYLSLFGGNEDDNGQANNPNNWWGNILENDSAYQYHSETQNLLMSIPATTNNLNRIEDAVKRDLAWLTEKKVVSSVDVLISMPGINKIKIKIDINADGSESSLEFNENWRAK